MTVLLTGIVLALTLVIFFIALSYVYNLGYKSGVETWTANAKSNWAVDALNKLMASARINRTNSAKQAGTTAPVSNRPTSFSSHKVGEWVATKEACCGNPEKCCPDKGECNEPCNNPEVTQPAPVEAASNVAEALDPVQPETINGFTWPIKQQ